MDCVSMDTVEMLRGLLDRGGLTRETIEEAGDTFTLVENLVERYTPHTSLQGMMGCGVACRSEIGGGWIKFQQFRILSGLFGEKGIKFRRGEVVAIADNLAKLQELITSLISKNGFGGGLYVLVWEKEGEYHLYYSTPEPLQRIRGYAIGCNKLFEPHGMWLVKVDLRAF